MDQSGHAKKREYKDNLFSRRVTLVKHDNKCTSFSDLKKNESKSEIEFSSSMTPNDVQKKIQETFPYLEYKRFSCAAFVKVDNDHKRYEFHGSPRVWDGKTIKKQIKGKSNLYILEEEVVQPTFTVTHDSNSTDKSEEDEQDTSSSSTEGDNKADVNPPSSSDTGFDEVMDISFNDSSMSFEPSTGHEINPSLDTIKTEEGTFLPASQMFDTSVLDSTFEEICFDSGSDEMSDDMNLLGVSPDILPISGPMKGGYQFNITFTEQLPADVYRGIAKFEGVADVQVHKLNPFTLTGTVPRSSVPGDVPVTVTTEACQGLGMTLFKYVDEMLEMVRQLVKNPAMQSTWFLNWSNEIRLLGTDNMHDQDSSAQTKQQQSVKVLQLLVYTAAQTDAQQFIEMIFSTSAGQIVFNSYKDKTPLPEDIAGANGHEDLAQFLRDINTRLSKETSDVQCNAIDWLELVKAVQKQASAVQDESSKRQKHPWVNDDNSSDYFADAETSSCGSFDLETGCSDSEGKAYLRSRGFLFSTLFILGILDILVILVILRQLITVKSNVKGGRHQVDPLHVACKNGLLDIENSTWTTFGNVISKDCLGFTSRRRLRLDESCSGRRNTVKSSVASIHADLFRRRTFGVCQCEEVCHYSQSNDNVKASNATCLHHQICVPSGYHRDGTMHQLSVSGKPDIFADSSAFNSSDRKTGKILAWLIYIEQVCSYGQQHHIETLRLLLVVIIAMCWMNCLMLLYMCLLKVRFNHQRFGRKEEASTPGKFTCNDFQCTLTQNRHIQASMEPQMERVRSWLACDLGQKKLASVDVGDSFDGLNFGEEQIDTKAFGQRIHAGILCPKGRGFPLCFGPLPEPVSRFARFASWTSDICKKVNGTLGGCYPIIPLPSDFKYDAFIVYHNDDTAFARRCLEEIMGRSVDGSTTKSQFMRGNNPVAHYYTCPNSTRQLVWPNCGPPSTVLHPCLTFWNQSDVISMSSPSTLTMVIALMLSAEREPVQVIFTQKVDRRVAGSHCVVEQRVFDHTVRDRHLDELTAVGETQFSQRNRCSRKGVTRNRGNRRNRRNRRKTGEHADAEIEVMDEENRQVDEKSPADGLETTA